jgi:serine/threonine protein kinase
MPLGDLLAGARLGGYELLHRMAVGGMGEVFLARHRGVAGFHRLVALKRLISDGEDAPDAVALFIDEARVAANLAHPNIVHVYDFGNDKGTYFLTMEFVPGQNLHRISARSSARKQPLPRPLAVHVIIEVLRGLEHAHTARDPDGRPLAIVHRDVSLSNVLVSYAGDVKLMDFGIAKAANALHRTRTGVVRGKLGYMSPEQLAGLPVDARTDVYAAGVMLWELTLGRPLFVGDNELEVAQRITASEIPSPHGIDPAYPAELEAIVMDALGPIDRRIPDAASFAKRLRAYQAEAAPSDPTAALGGFVRELFAEEAGALDALVRDVGRVEPVPAAAPDETTRKDLGATTPIRAPERAASRAASSGPRTAVWAGVAGLVVAIGAVLAVARSRGGGVDSDPPATSASGATPSPSPATALAPPPDALPAPESDESPMPIAESTPPTDAAPSRSRTPARKDRTPTPTMAVAPDRETSVEDSVPVPPAASTPERGTLSVSSEPWGAVTIDGHPRKNTPLQTDLAAGTHELRVDVTEGIGALTARFEIAAGKRTKCRVVERSLRCSAPQ